MLSLRTRAYILYWSITALIALPCLLLLFIGMTCYYTYFFRDAGEDCIAGCMSMIHWRTDKVYWYIQDEKQGFRLTIE